jgi:hypothetical protein
MNNVIPFPDAQNQQASELVELMEAFLASYSAESIVLAMSRAATSQEDKDFLEPIVAPIIDKL